MSFRSPQSSRFLPFAGIAALTFLPTLASAIAHATNQYSIGLVLRICIQLVLPIALTVAWSNVSIKNAFLLPLTPLPKRIRWTEYTGAILALTAIGVILSAYYIFYSFIDFTAIQESLTAKNSVTATTYPLIALCVALLNPFLEEYFWRGFIYRNLAQTAPNRAWRITSLWLTGALFALHHTIIIQGWFVWWQWIIVTVFLSLVGVLFNWLYAKSGSILVGLMVHTAADITLAFLGLVVFGIIQL